MKRVCTVLLSVALLACSKPSKVPVEEHLKTTRLPGSVASHVDDGDKAGASAKGAAAGAAGATSKDDDTVVARYDGGQLTVAGVRHWIEHLTEIDRIRYQSADTKRELVQEIVSMELLAREALDQGYGEKEELRLLLKMEVARRYLEDRVRQSVSLKDIRPEDVDAYYREHRAEFIRGETRRLSRIVVASEALARQIRSEIDAELGEGAGDKGVAVFGKALQRYTEEIQGRRDKGVVGWIDVAGLVHGIVERRQVCEDAAKAAFAVPAEGGIAGPVACEGKYSILLVDGRRAPVQLSRKEVASRIKNRLLQARKEAAKREIIKGLVAGAEIQIHDERLRALAPLRARKSPSAGPKPSGFRPPSLLKHGASMKGMKPIRAETSRSFERLDPQKKKAILDEQADKALK